MDRGAWYNVVRERIDADPHLSIRQVAALMSKPYTTVYSWLKGDREPTINQIRQLTNIVGLTLSEAIEAGDTVIARTEQEKRLLAAFRGLPEEQRASLAQIIRALSE